MGTHGVPQKDPFSLIVMATTIFAIKVDLSFR
jgi:hypothetical protein